MFVYAKTPGFAADPFFTRGVSAGVVETLRTRLIKTKRSDLYFDRYSNTYAAYC